MEHIRSVPWPKHDSPLVTTNLLFRLHSGWTVSFLLLAAGVNYYSEFTEERLNCIVGDNEMSAYTNTFCLMSPLYADGNQPLNDHTFYQWVCLVLIVQAGSFYFGHIVWDFLEGGTLGLLKGEFQNRGLFIWDVEESSPAWVAGLVVAELVNSANLALQVWATEKFLGGNFYTLGFDWFLGGKQAEKVFPKMVTCIMKKYGPSGGVQTYDAFCFLPFNKINEYTFVFLWFWYSFLAVSSALGHLWRLLVLVPLPRWVWATPLFCSLALQPFASSKFRASLDSRRVSPSGWLLTNYLMTNLSVEQSVQLMYHLQADHPLSVRIIEKNAYLESKQ